MSQRESIEEIEAEIETLRIALVNAKVKIAKQYDEAYPDVGMPLPASLYREQAIKELKREGIIPQNWEYPD